jgi:hypothetical protein
MPEPPAGASQACIDAYNDRNQWDDAAFQQLCALCANNQTCQRKWRDMRIEEALESVNLLFDCVGDSSETQAWLTAAVAAINAQSDP